MAQRPANPVPASLQGRQRDKDTTAVIYGGMGMETKYTKGPWKAVSALVRFEFNCMEIAEVDYMRVVPECGGWPSRIGVPEANARLIAAAPELLEALIDALALIELVMPIEGDVTRNARKAIAKAEGR